jgi:hypothetical protein
MILLINRALLFPIKFKNILSPKYKLAHAKDNVASIYIKPGKVQERVNETYPEIEAVKI